MTERQKQKVTWWTGVLSKSVSGIIVLIIGGWCLSKGEQVSVMLDAWGEMPAVVQKVRNQPVIDAQQDAVTQELFQTIEENHREVHELKKEMSVKLQAIEYGVNDIRHTLKMNPIFVPSGRDHVDLREKLK